MPLKYSDYIKRFEDEKESRAYVQSMTSSGSRRNDSQVPTTNIMEEPPKKNLFSTTKYTGGKVATGATSIFEGLADAGAWGLIQAGKITSWMLDNKVGKFIFGKEAGDVDSNVLYDIGTRMRDDKVVETLDTVLDSSKTAQKSYIKPGSLGASVASGVGQVGAMILTGNMLGLQGTASKVTETSTKAQKILDNARVAINNPSTRVMFASTFGNGYSQAMTEGANELEATTYGILNAVKESATEMMYGGLGTAFGKGALDDIAKEAIENTIKSKVLSKTTQLGIGMFAEGLEEVVASLLDPFIEQVYTHNLDFSSYDSLLDDFVVGSLVSGILQTPGTIVDLKSKNPEQISQQLQENNVKTKLDKINTDTKKIVSNKNIKNDTKVNRINNQIDILNDVLTTDVKIGTIDIESLYNQKQELISQREEIAKKMTEEEKIETVKTLSTQVNEVFKSENENITPAVVESLTDKVEQIEKMTEDVEKDKKIKVLSNKQKVESNSEAYINEASSIIDRLNMNIPEGQKRIEIVTELNQEQHQVMDLGAVFGKQVIFTNNMPHSGLISQNNPNILFIDNKATSQLVTNKQATTLYVLGHELYHSMKQTNPETYTQFTDYVKQNITIEQIVDFAQKYDPKNANQMLDALKINGEFNLNEVKKHYLKYKTQNAALDYIVEEMTANEFGGMITDSKYMNDLYNANKSLFQKVITAIRDLFKSLTGSAYNSSLTQLQVEKIRNDFENIVSDIGQIKETEYRYHNTSPDAIKSIIKEGLLPNEGVYGNGVYFAPTVEDTENWYGDKGAVLRVDKNKLDSYDEFTDQGWNNDSVPSNLLEVSYDKGKTWKPLITQTKQNVKPAVQTETVKKETKTKETNEITKLTDVEKLARNRWVGSDSYKINDALRRDIELTEMLKTTSDEMSNLLKKFDNYKGTLYRSMILEGDALTKFIAENQPGEIVNNKSFVSASNQIYDDTMNVQMTIHSKHAKDVSQLMRKNESEFLFDKGMQYEVLSADFSDTNNIKLEVQEVDKIPSKPVETKEEVKPGTQGMKTTQMDMGVWFNSISKMYDKYVETKDSERLTAVTTAYENYKKKGGTEVISELDLVIETKNKSDFKSKLKDAGLEIKALPKETTDTAGQQKESQFYANTAVNSPVFKSIIDGLSKNKDFRYYSTVSHKGDFNKAIERIQQRGDAAITDFMATKSFDSVDSAMAKILMQYYQKLGDVHSETNVAMKVREDTTRRAQVVEAAKIFKMMSPASMLLQVETDLNRAYESLQESGDPIVRAWLNEKAEVVFTEAEKDWLYQNFAKLQKLDANSREYAVKHALIQSFVANKIPKSIATKAKAFRRIAMLFNPKTMGRNMLGNVVVIPAHRSADRFGSYLDSFLAKQTGVRTTGGRNVQAYKKGRTRGLKYAKQDFQLGINTDVANAFEKQTGKTWKDSDLKGAGKVLNYMEKWMNYGLDIGDRPFYEAYYENSIVNQMRLNNVTEPTQSMIEIAQAEALKKTWKNNGKMVQLASTVRRIGNMVGFKNRKLSYDSQGNVDLGVGDIILPFIMTPANLAVAIYDYSPAAFASVYKNAKTFNNAVKSGKNVEFAQKALVDSFGRASTGVVLFAIAYVLANAGLISGGEDEDKDVRALMRAQGYQPYSIKIGDTTFSYDWAQPIANPFAIMAELNRQTEMNKNNPNKSDEANNMFKAVSEAFTLGADRLYEQSFLQSLKNIFSAETPQEAFINFTGDIPASFVPTLFKQIADTIDGNAKATYDKNNLLTSMFARAAVKIPVLKSTLPTKKDVLGNNIELFGGENNIFNTMLFPFNVSKDKAGDIGKELSDVYNHTGEKGIMPQVAVRYIDYDTNGDGIKERITFDNAQQSALQSIMGKLSADTVYEMLNNSVYQNASYEDKATALTSLVQYAKAVALRDSGLVPNYEIKGGNAAQIDNYVNKGLSIPDAVMYDSLINPIKSLKNNSGETIQGSANGQKAYTIMNMQISDSSKNIMLQLISPTSKNPETVSSLSKLSTVQQYIDYYSLSRTDYTIINKYSRDDYDISTQYFNIDGTTYTKFANEVSEIRADVDAEGNAIANSKKNKVFEYINSLPLNQYQKLYLFSVSGYSIKSYSNQMFSYINSLDISAEEKLQIWTSLGLK